MSLAFNKKHECAVSKMDLEQARLILKCLKSNLPAAFKENSPYKRFDDLYLHALDMDSTRVLLLLDDLFGIKHTSPNPKEIRCPYVTLSRDFLVNFKIYSEQKFNELSLEFDSFPEDIDEKTKEHAIASSIIYFNVGVWIFNDKLNFL